MRAGAALAMLRRRGFLGLLASAPATAPVMARELVTGQIPLGIAGSALKSDYDDGPEDPDCSNGSYKDEVCKPKNNYWTEQIQRYIKDYRKLKAKPLSYYVRAVTRLDADLQCNRSLSLSAKIRLQAIRDKDYDISVHKKYLSENIATFRAEMRTPGVF